MIAVLFWWGAGMGAIGLVGDLFYGYGDAESPALFYGTAALLVAIAVGLRVTGYGRNDTLGVRAIPDTSPPVVLLAAALLFAALGATLGWWLSLIGALLGAIAIGGLIREGLAQRADGRRARASDDAGARSDGHAQDRPAGPGAGARP